MKRRRLVLVGRVQGVGLRYLIAKKARANSLVGFVANLPDGQVAAEIQGNAAAIDNFTQWLQTSPGWSKIDNLTYQDIALTDDKIFTIHD